MQTNDADSRYVHTKGVILAGQKVRTSIVHKFYAKRFKDYHGRPGQVCNLQLMLTKVTISRIQYLRTSNNMWYILIIALLQRTHQKVHPMAATNPTMDPCVGGVLFTAIILSH